MKHFRFILILSIALILTFNVSLKAETITPMPSSSSPLIDDSVSTKPISTDSFLTLLYEAFGDAIELPLLTQNKEILTREKMAIILVDALGYGELAKEFDRVSLPYTDVENNKGHILFMTDWMTTNEESTEFHPKQEVTYGEAITYLLELHKKINSPIESLYALSSTNADPSYLKLPLKGAGIIQCKMDYDLESGKVMCQQDVLFPDPEEISSAVKKNKISAYMHVTSGANINAFLDDQKAIETFIDELALLLISSSTHDLKLEGVFLDFQGMDYKHKKAYLDFISQLGPILKALDQECYIVLTPPLLYGSEDYTLLSKETDGIIVTSQNTTPIMDHPSSGIEKLPSSSLSDLYYSLHTLSNSNALSPDNSTSFQLCFNNPINGESSNYYDINKVIDSSQKIVMDYSYGFANATVTKSTGKTLNYWYEDKETIVKKIRLAKLFGIQNLVLDDLGSMPKSISAYKNNNFNVLSYLSSLFTQYKPPQLTYTTGGSQPTSTETLIIPEPTDIDETTEPPKEENKIDIPQPKITAKTAMVIDGSSGEVLYTKNQNAKRNPASMTKLMLMYLLLEDIKAGRYTWSDTVVASAKAASTPGKNVRIKTGDTFTLDTLFKSMVIESGCDASVALAEFMEGSENAYVARANKKAKELGMYSTHFADCHGLAQYNHYTTAEDLALLSKLLIWSYPEILDIAAIKKTTTYRIRNGQSIHYILDTTNDLLKFYPYANGLKTGFHDVAGYCVTATAKKNGTFLIAVVMGASSDQQRFYDAQKLLDYGFLVSE